MKAAQTTVLACIVAIAATLAVVGCEESGKDKAGSVDKSQVGIEPGVTIGSLVDVFSPKFIPVQGYALVGELNGTGSLECPAPVRAYLKQYILKHLPASKVDSFINSKDTAVVLLEGLLPTAATSDEYFDVYVKALEGTQTRSLEGGQIYGADLWVAGGIGFGSKILARVEGPVYIDQLDGPPAEMRSGYILAGAGVLDEYRIFLILRKPDYLTASTIRNKLIENFGDHVARAVAADKIELRVPARYKQQKQRFISIVRAIHLNPTAEQIQQEIAQAVAALAGSSDRDSAEIMLESIGNTALGNLTGLLSSSDEQVRLRTARCMLNLGNDTGLNTLRQIALDENSAYRIEALRAITNAARHNDAAAISRRLLRDSSLEMRLEAYEQLRKLDDVAITSELIGKKFYLEQIAGTSYKTIFVSRSGRPGIAVFGGPIYCKKDLFVQSWNGNITINAQADEDYATVIRRVPGKPEIAPLTLKSTYELSSIIRTLGAEPIRENKDKCLGLAVSYADIISLLKQMVEKGAIDAEFEAGAMPKINLKK